MLKPTVQVHNVNEILVAEFWDCLRLDPAPVVDLRNKYEAHVGGQGRPELVIDLLGVEFAGSAALGHFVMLHRLAKQRGGRLIFCNVDPMVSEVFRVSKLEALFSFAPDRAAALVMVENAPAASPSPPSAPLNRSVEPNTPPRSPQRGPLNNSSGNGLLRGSRRRKLS